VKPAAAAIFLLVVLLLFFFEEQASAADTASSGYYQFPPPPADDFSNSEVGDIFQGGANVAVTPEKIDLLAQAIATAEGWTNADPNVVPRRAHNPGDLTKSFGQPTTGIANSEGVLIFADDDAGWSALKAQCTAMLTGGSHVYTPLMTIRLVARKYTGGDNSDSWAENAARVLGISADQTLKDFLAL
jgi:hypothetical protein